MMGPYTKPLEDGTWLIVSPCICPDEDRFPNPDDEEFCEENRFEIIVRFTFCSVAQRESGSLIS